jgi:hypothetical protein
MSANEYDSLDSNFLRYVVRHLQIGHRNKKPITAPDLNSCGSRWRCLFWGLPRLTSNMFASCPNETVEKQRFQFVFLSLSSIFSDFCLVSVLFIQMWKRIVPANPAQGQG